ncbi:MULTISPECIES: hypothetical protein [unclassified Micromonospora]|uniref:hypothetical protein n=1 Tax=unclassified Micromonospora TaxID=2617518 RepID=UPI0022B62498|nr:MULTISPECIES: hypothetical protein [unclassified Micromonospora]MCZ7420184.1 hypothetical protein [Verrucosispora sp. WMMA2121]WBB89301.1 hypothetical protein O7597_20050 [Verrucosispora sp. WMMC514]
MSQDGSTQQRVRRGRRRFLLVVVATMVASLVLGAALAASGVVAVDSDFWDGGPPGWAQVLGAVFTVGGLVFAVGGFWWLVRSGYYRRNARSVLWAQSWSRRRQLVRQVRGDAPYLDEDLRLLRRVAAQMVDQPGFLLPMAALSLVQVGQAFFQWAPAFVIIAAVITGGFAVAAVAVVRDARRARAFLAAEPADDAVPQL